MNKWLKRIRGALGIGLTWGMAWSVVGVVVGLVVGFLSGWAPGVVAAFVVDVVVRLAAMGLLGGTAFSVVLGIVEGRRRFDQMSLPRFAAWGAAAGLLLSAILLGTGGSIPLFGAVVVASVGALLGAGSAAGSLALARRADDRELLEAGAGVADIGLTAEEKGALLGK